MVIVGDGIKARMTENEDHPIEDSSWRKNSDGTEVEECRGTKGRYIASNASGNWETVLAPFE